MYLVHVFGPFVILAPSHREGDAGVVDFELLVG